MERRALLDIAEIISDGDGAVLEELARCVGDPGAYYAAHCARYEERGVYSAGDAEQICWLGMVDILESRGHVCERDWKDEKPDFLHFFSGLAGTKRLGLEIRGEWLAEDGDIQSWCGVLDGKWAPLHCCAAIGIDSDSYVLFPCRLDTLERLTRLAEQTAYCIEKV